MRSVRGPHRPHIPRTTPLQRYERRWCPRALGEIGESDVAQFIPECTADSRARRRMGTNICRKARGRI